MGSRRVHCDGFHTRILAHGNGGMGLRDYLGVVCCGGVAAEAIPVATGGWCAGRAIGCHVSGDTDAGILRNGFGQSGIGCCGGGEESGGCGR